ncbi:Lipoprotein [Methylorubrum aminovorans]
MPRRRPRGRVTALLGGLALWLVAGSGCDTALDARRATLCRRALPALAPPGAEIDLLRVGPGARSGSVRVDYRLTGGSGSLPKAEAMRPRHLVCQFGAGDDLTALTTEQGPVNGASLYLLRRYYLATPEAEAADPGTR